MRPESLLSLSLCATFFPGLTDLWPSLHPHPNRHHTQDPYTIDLHGVTLSHALTIVTESCNSWWAANRDCKLLTSGRSPSRSDCT